MHPKHRIRRRAGLTLIEVVIAILVFAVGGLGLAASSAALARQMSGSVLRARAAAIAATRAEEMHAAGCSGSSNGDERILGVRSLWEIASAGAATLEQTLERNDGYGLHSDRFLSAASCE